MLLPVDWDGAAKLFDAVEKATQDVLQSSSLMTQNVVSHRSKIHLSFSHSNNLKCAL